MALLGVPAEAAELAPSNLELPGLVVVNPDLAQPGVNGSIFYPTGEISADTRVVVPDDQGLFLGNLTFNEVKASATTKSADGVLALMKDMQARNASSVVITPFAAQMVWSAAPNSWGPIITHTSGMIGTSDNATVRYGYSVQEGTNQSGYAQGLGYYRGYNGSQFGTWSAWYSLGYSTSNSPGGATVPWGNTMGVPKFQGKSTSLVHMANGRWWF